MLERFDGSGKPGTLVSSKGKIDSLRWSPEGSRVTFVSKRETHAIVEVYDFTKKSIAWLAPSVDHDLDSEWSPDEAYVNKESNLSRSFIPDEVHDLILYRNLLTVFEATDNFFDRHLIRNQEQK